MQFRHIILTITLALLSAGVMAQAPLVKDLGYRGGSIDGLKKIPDALHFIVMGDWGRNGENYQKEVAEKWGVPRMT